MVTLEIQPHLSCRSGLREAPERGESALGEMLSEFLGISLGYTTHHDAHDVIVAAGSCESA